MELNQLRYLLKLSEIQNFSKAAEALYITQPTLSQQIYRLEQELGVKLFERSTRKVVLTEAGNNCVIYARKALEQIDEMTAVAQRYSRSQNSRLLVGILTVLPQVNITDVIAEFREIYKDIEVEILFGWSTELIHMLLQKKVDVIISNLYFAETDDIVEQLDITPFLIDRMAAVVSKKSRFADLKGIRLEEITDEKFWSVDEHSSVKIEVERQIRKKGLSMPEFKQCNSMASVFKMVAANMGISVMSFGVAREYRIPEVKIIPVVPKIRTSTAIVTLKGSSGSSHLEEFTKYFLSSIKK